MYPFSIYVADVESTGLTTDHDIIELSLLRLNDGVQRTWCLYPLSPDKIEKEALRINQHKEEDLLHKTEFGKETYLDPNKVIVDIENWLQEDGVASDERILCGQNIAAFDRGMLMALWNKCKSMETFPFSKRFTIDTMIIELFLSVVENKKNDYYNLAGLVSKYGVKKLKAHSASQDTIMTKDVLLQQIKRVKNWNSESEKNSIVRNGEN